MNNSSLNPQHFAFFETTVIKYLLQLQKFFQMWKNNWGWTECLKFDGIGSPVNVINNLKSVTFESDIFDHDQRA